MFTKKMLRFVAALAGVEVKFFRNGAAHLRGPIDRLEAVRDNAIRSKILGDMRLIVDEKVNGVSTGKAPRIEIHPSLIER